MRVQSACKTLRCVLSSHPQTHALTLYAVFVLLFEMRKVRQTNIFVLLVYRQDFSVFISLKWWTFYRQFMLHCGLKQTFCECLYLTIVHLRETGGWRTCRIFSPHGRTCWTLFLKIFSSVSLPWYASGVCVCVCVCVQVCACACVCVCAFILYALNFDNMYL